MEVLKTKLNGVLLIKPDVYKDFRGENLELYNDKIYPEKRIGMKFVQDNISVSSKNVLRGIHGDEKTWKLVSCIYGEIYFVVVNCDESSEDFGKWESFSLTGENHWQVLVPAKFGNAHLVLSDKAVFHYRWSEYYTPRQFTYGWDDARFGISWPVKNPILSPRDQLL